MSAARLTSSLSVAAVLIGGCVAREGAPPPYPVDQGQDPDVRAIDEVGDPAPEGPITPAGAEEPPVEGDFAPGVDAGEPEGYRTVNGVVGEINGRAIYASEVLEGPRRNQLRAMALRMSASEFQRAAASILEDEILQRVRDKVLLSVFERNATASERRLAVLMTTAWRQQFVTQNGGSEALARRAALDQYGMSLEALGEDEYERHLSAAFARKHMVPNVRPSAREVREEYARQKAAGLLDEPGAIDFSVIEIKPQGAGETSVAEAREEAQSVRERAANGEDFAELARAHSDNEALAASGGRLPDSILPLRPGAYAVPEVDAAAWRTVAGEVADAVVETGAGGRTRLYVVRVNERKDPRTLAFEEVQRRLSTEMASREQQRLFDGYLRREIARVEEPDQRQKNTMMRTALEVVMQEYDRWRAEAGVDAATSAAR